MENIPDVVSKTIDVLSQKFGATGIELWRVLVKQAYINGIESVFVAIVMGIGLIFSVKLIKKAIKADEEGDESFGFWIGGVILTAILVGILIPSIIGAIDDFSNPQYQAIQSLIGK